MYVFEKRAYSFMNECNLGNCEFRASLSLLFHPFDLSLSERGMIKSTLKEKLSCEKL